MTVKIYFKNQIHRFTKLQENLQALFAQINTLFKDELPSAWVLQYVDSDGDHIIVSHEHDFKELTNLESANSTTTIKLHVVPVEGGVSKASVETTHAEPAKHSNSGDYEVISQNKEEKSATAVSQQQHQTEANEPQVTFNPQKKECKNKFRHAKELSKRLWKGECDETERNQIIAELTKIRESLTEEEKEEFAHKRAKFEAKFARFGHHFGGHHRGPHGHHHSPQHHGEGHHSHHGHHHRHHGHHGFPGHHQKHFSPSFSPFCRKSDSSEGRDSSCEKKMWHKRFAGGFEGFRGFGGFGGFKGFGGFGKFKCHDREGEGFFRGRDEKARGLFGIMRVFKKMFRAQKEGNTEKAAEKKAKLFEMIPEDAKPLLEAILASLPQDLDKKALKERKVEGMKKFLETCFPEGKDKILEEFEKMREKRKEKRQKFRAMWEEKKKMFGENWHQQRAELTEKYSEDVFRKAMKMKMIFINDEISALCEYVSKKTAEATMEELVLNYRK